jgi:hypothetical protein
MKIFISILIFATCFNFGVIANMPKNNLSVFNEFSLSAAEKVAEMINQDRIPGVIISTAPEKLSMIVENPLTRILSDKGIKILSSDSTGRITQVQLAIRKAFVVYEKDPLEDDSLFRRIEFELEGTLQCEGIIIPIPLISKAYSDMISREDINSIENKAYEFTTADVPERDNWFYKSIIEPVIVFGTAAVAVILLFTVRSQ